MEQPTPPQLPLLMVVDDDPRILRSWARVVRRLPVRLLSALSAEEALATIAREGPPALLISDYQLPGLDGVGLLLRIKHSHPAVRVVLSTGTTKLPPQDSGIQTLPKPIEPRELQRLLSSLGAAPAIDG